MLAYRRDTRPNQTARKVRQTLKKRESRSRRPRNAPTVLQGFSAQAMQTLQIPIFPTPKNLLPDQQSSIFHGRHPTFNDGGGPKFSSKAIPSRLLSHQPLCLSQQNGIPPTTSLVLLSRAGSVDAVMPVACMMMASLRAAWAFGVWLRRAVEHRRPVSRHGTLATPPGHAQSPTSRHRTRPG